MKNISKLLFLINICINFIPVYDIKQNTCVSKSNISPIDINYPLKFLEFQMQYIFKPLKYAKLEKKEQVISFNGEFGIINYNNIQYTVKQIIFISPSEHLMGYNRFSIEMQIIAKNKDNENLKIINFFEENLNEYNEFWTKMDFGTNKIKKSKNNKIYIFSDKINLSELITDSTGLFMYTGSETFGSSCKEELIFISNRVSIIHKNQLKEFTEKKIRSPVKSRSDQIYLFVNKKEYVNFNKTKEIKFLKTPGSILYDDYLFNPDKKKKFGYIDNLNIPFWKKNMWKLVDIVKISPLPIVNKNWIYKILYYKPIINPLSPYFKKYIPVHILVKKNSTFLKTNKNPKIIKLFLRSKITNEIGVFPINYVEMNINYTPPEDYLFRRESKEEIDLKKKFKIKKKIEESKIILKKIEKIKKEEQKKPVNIQYIKHKCIKHDLQVILNEPHNKEINKPKQRKKSKKTCKEWISYIHKDIAYHALNLIEAKGLNYKLNRDCIKLRAILNNGSDDVKFIKDELFKVCPKLEIRHNSSQIISLLNNLKNNIKKNGIDVQKLDLGNPMKSKRITQYLK